MASHAIQELFPLFAYSLDAHVEAQVEVLAVKKYPYEQVVHNTLLLLLLYEQLPQLRSVGQTLQVELVSLA